MTNLVLHYIHRDESNWKDRFEACIQNPSNFTPGQAEQMIRECLIDREFFYPEKVGLSFSIATDWHELDRVEVDEVGVTPLPMNLERLVDKLKESNKAHLKSIRIYQVANWIPIRLAVSWLEFLRDLRYEIESALEVPNEIAGLLRKRRNEHIEKMIGRGM